MQVLATHLRSISEELQGYLETAYRMWDPASDWHKHNAVWLGFTYLPELGSTPREQMQLSHHQVSSVEYAWKETKTEPDPSQATLRACPAFFRPHSDRKAYAFFVASAYTFRNGVHKVEGSHYVPFRLEQQLAKPLSKPLPRSDRWFEGLQAALAAPPPTLPTATSAFTEWCKKEDPEYWDRLTLWVRKDSSVLSPAQRRSAAREIGRAHV